MQRAALICFLFCLFLLLPAWGDPLDESPLGACYMGYGKMLEAARSRQLSLNAHVQQFLYQPGGLGIAYQGMEKNGDELTQFVRLVGVNKGTVTNLVSTATHIGDDADQNGTDDVSYGLESWSGDGRYLLLSQNHFVIPPSGDGYRDERFTCVDVGVIPPHLTPIPLPQVGPVDKGSSLSFVHWWWSPDRGQIVFTLPEIVRQDDLHFLRENYCQVYDLKTRSLQAVTLDDKQLVRGWLDNRHLLIDDAKSLTESRLDPKADYSSCDLTAGTLTAIPMPKTVLALPNGIDLAHDNVSPKAAYMTLDDEVHHIQDQQKLGAINAHALWIRRTQGPKLMSAAPVGLTPGSDDPQAVWSPTGNQIAFIAHGDLFVTDLTLRDATAVEKYAAGEKLTCPEERELAANNLKQVGLAIIQYTQDYDEKFPPADHWQDSVTPYLKDTSLFTPAGHPVIYRAPANLALASMADPKDTVMGIVDLPCATVTLYADGHVKSVMKPGNE